MWRAAGGEAAVGRPGVLDPAAERRRTPARRPARRRREVPLHQHPLLRHLRLRRLLLDARADGGGRPTQRHLHALRLAGRPQQPRRLQGQAAAAPLTTSAPMTQRYCFE